jgi:hypothetical protein
MTARRDEGLDEGGWEWGDEGRVGMVGGGEGM